KAAFERTLTEVAKHFKSVYAELTNGEADLALENPETIESGLMIRAQPPGKRLLAIDSMSGGEKTLTAFAFLFAIQRHKPMPFYILDEADAALDKANSKRVVELLRSHAQSAQFIVVTHNDHTIRGADQVYGVSMEDGESKVIALQLPSDGGAPVVARSLMEEAVEEPEN
ncbi:MAG TPA: AAA family ATPase, partial [archaeon]|nr:AAA family ATPase [archaeon]